MARRTELDLLEEDSPSEEIIEAGSLDGKDGEEIKGAVILSRWGKLWQTILSPAGEEKYPVVKILRCRKVRLSFTAACLLILIGGSIWLWGGHNQTAILPPPEPGAMEPCVAKGGRIDVDDFSIDLKDRQGRYRFLVCDLILELGRDFRLTGDRRVDIRKTVYATAKKNGNDLLKSSEAQKIFKQEVKGQLNQLLGEDTVQEVYITKFTLL
jgi:flagellar basal body-associated protein FliL